MTPMKWHSMGAHVLLAALAVLPLTAFAEGPRTDESARLRGPLHEAFVQPLAGADKPGLTIGRRPAAARDEIPAAIKPTAPNAAWLPGYWGWDPADEAFLWVPGVWRVPPPGMRWVPGYWHEQDDGWQWVRGFWYPVMEPRLPYRPYPPDLAEEPPAARSADEFGVGGHWSYVRGQYIWNRGFTARHKAGWAWMPSHYMWTPRGAIFVPGYWDYPLDARGLPLAPVRVASATQPSAAGTTAFVPKVAVNLGDLSEALFVSAGYGHYYFGDYFESDVVDLKPWHEPDAETGLEPSFAYERWRHRAEADWTEKLADRYRHRREDAKLRPTVLFAERRQSDMKAASNVPELGVSLSALARSRGVAQSVTEIAPESVRRVTQHSAAIKLLAVQRAKFETSGAAATPESPLAFYLPAPVELRERTRSTSQAKGATAGQYVPGVAGRRVPGTSGERLPGMSGRTLPGIDVNVPGTVAPDVVPGADTGGQPPR